MAMTPTHRVKYLTEVAQIQQLSRPETAALEAVTERFAFRCNEYYLSLINWEDPDDPIRRAVVPHVQELD